MRRLTCLDADAYEIYARCSSGVRDAALIERFQMVGEEVVEHYQCYSSLARVNQLFRVVPCNRGDGAQVVLPNISKQDFIDLYSCQMAKDGRPGREYYDKIRMLAPLGKCPYCGFGQVSTLDHFLSKSYYPMFSIFPGNLIPSCADCNKDKGSSVLTEYNQTLHPYFESDSIDLRRWVFAEVVHSTPAVVRYFANPPSEWDGGLRQRIFNHFSSGLSKRFSVEAASELAELSRLLQFFETKEERRTHLARVAQSSALNSWKAALYCALTESEWYLDHGFKEGMG
ncbi:HNH endonuclease [Chromobacterium alkanivorans]|uniref:HNH endonuclease n=1 Tax=Chromobacterium alkanivorans TaxID=1071719 RepID=UPI00196810E7|nr:HNH endonuclease [Chromobacterium alkanivorans]MBN3002520.1 HNH endonuclease [Chromobacterium alkanivorans]